MRILWIKTELLHPVDKGGKIRTYQMLRALRRDHEVTYVALDDGTAAPNALEMAQEYATRTELVPFRPPARRSLGFTFDLLKNLVSALPYAIQRYQSAELRQRVRKLSRSVDIVICDFLMPSQNVSNDLEVPKILFQHNVEAVIWERHAQIPGNVFRRTYMRAQWRRMLRFESAECRRFDHVVAVSETDATLIRDGYGVKSVSFVGTGVDTEYFSPPGDERSKVEIVFVGTMDWMPNDDGVQWFVREVLPQVQERVPGATLTIVGRRPSEGLERLAARSTGVHVTGTVSDVRPYLARAAVSVVPLRVGGGTRLKIYEAMAMGAPIVSTAIGAEGLPVQHGEHLLIADSPHDLAAAIARLLKDRAAATRLAQNALQHVQQHCSWSAVASQFIADCTAATRNQTTR